MHAWQERTLRRCQVNKFGMIGTEDDETFSVRLVSGSDGERATFEINDAEIVVCVPADTVTRQSLPMAADFIRRAGFNCRQLQR